MSVFLRSMLKLWECPPPGLVMGEADKTFACKSQECLVLDWYIPYLEFKINIDKVLPMTR